MESAIMTLSFDGEILLAGGGDADDSWRLDEWLVQQIGQDATIGYIPVAMASEHYPDCEEWLTGVFEEHGLSDIRMWTTLEDISASDLATVSAVYIGGGNTYRLLNELRQTRADSLLREFVDSGGRLYGGSAGAIICGETIGTTPDENRVGLSETDALRFLPETDIWCHYANADDPDIHDYVAETGRTVIALPERSGVSVTATRLQVIGHDPVSVFDGETKTKRVPDEQFDLSEVDESSARHLGN